MKELTKIKEIVEKVTGIEDISSKSRLSENVAARSFYYVIAVNHFKDIGLRLNSENKEIIAKVVNRKRLTLDHSLETFKNDFTPANMENLKAVERLFYKDKNGLNSKRKEVLELREKVYQLEDEINTITSKKSDIENWFSRFTEDQIEEIKPRIRAFMQLNKIAS